MVRYHRPTKVLVCPKCFASMKMGERVYVTLGFEQGDRFNRLGVSGFLCRECASAIAESMGLKDAVSSASGKGERPPHEEDFGWMAD